MSWDCRQGAVPPKNLSLTRKRFVLCRAGKVPDSSTAAGPAGAAAGLPNRNGEPGPEPRLRAGRGLTGETALVLPGHPPPAPHGSQSPAPAARPARSSVRPPHPPPHPARPIRPRPGPRGGRHRPARLCAMRSTGPRVAKEPRGSQRPWSPRANASTRQLAAALATNSTSRPQQKRAGCRWHGTTRCEPKGCRLYSRTIAPARGPAAPPSPAALSAPRPRRAWRHRDAIAPSAPPRGPADGLYASEGGALRGTCGSRSPFPPSRLYRTRREGGKKKKGKPTKKPKPNPKVFSPIQD